MRRFVHELRERACLRVCKDYRSLDVGADDDDVCVLQVCLRACACARACVRVCMLVCVSVCLCECVLCVGVTKLITVWRLVCVCVCERLCSCVCVCVRVACRCLHLCV